jgi:hypothetical protein
LDESSFSVRKTTMTNPSAARFVAQLWAICYAITALCLPVASAFGADHKYTICSGEFALCAASTCQPTGRSITVNVTSGGTASFPEADCTCPIFSGPALADLTGGNMQGTCTPPPDQIWSLFQSRLEIPQAITDWQLSPAPWQACPASLRQGNQQVNCGSFACDKAGEINGIPVATCHCALGESPNGTPVPADTSFLIQVGQGNQTLCYQHPVGGPELPGASGVLADVEQGKPVAAACYENPQHDRSQFVSTVYRNVVKTQFDPDAGTRPGVCGLAPEIHIPDDLP